jgi:hypothetical protein
VFDSVVVRVDVVYVDVGSDPLRRGRPELFFHYLKNMLHCIRSVLYSFAELIFCFFFQASAWLNTSKDPIYGNDKRRDTF